MARSWRSRCTRSGSKARSCHPDHGRVGSGRNVNGDINAFERHLDRSGTKVVKFFLHVSKAEQKRRFLARLDTPGKEWNFRASDVAERAHWDEYMRAFEDAIRATSKTWAPWYVIPADHKQVMQAMLARILVETVRSLGLSWPEVTDEDHARHAEARRELAAE